jgi:hypothetical protein
LIFFILFLYRPCLSLPFLSDDYCGLSRCESHPGLESLEFLKPGFYFRLYRPITQFSFCALYRLFDLKPLGYHLFSLGLHFINTLLVFGLLVWIMDTRRALSLILAVTGSWLFFINGRHHDSVLWPAAMNELLCAFFGLSAFLACILHSQTQKRGFFILSLLAILLCLGSKETREPDLSFKSLAGHLGPWLVIISAYFCLYLSRRGQVHGAELEPFRNGLSNLPAEFILRVIGAVFPLKLDQAQIDKLLVAFSDHAWLISACLVFLVALVIISRRNRLQVAGAGILLMVIPGFFFTGINPSGDRLFYSVSLFSVVFLVASVSGLSWRIKSMPVRAVSGIILCMLIAAGMYYHGRLLGQNLRMRAGAGLWAETMLQANIEYFREHPAPESGVVYWAGSPRFHERIYVLGACLTDAVNLRLPSRILNNVVQVSYLERKAGRNLQSFNPEFDPENISNNDIIFYFDGREAGLISKHDLDRQWRKGQRRLKEKQ